MKKIFFIWLILSLISSCSSQLFDSQESFTSELSTNNTIDSNDQHSKTYPQKVKVSPRQEKKSELSMVLNEYLDKPVPKNRKTLPSLSTPFTTTTTTSVQTPASQETEPVSQKKEKLTDEELAILIREIEEEAGISTPIKVKTTESNTKPTPKPKKQIEQRRIIKKRIVPVKRNLDSITLKKIIVNRQRVAKQTTIPIRRAIITSTPTITTRRLISSKETSISIERNPEEILSSYRIGKGDFLDIKVFGEEDFSLKSHVSKGGTISYPFLGELLLEGLTVMEIEKLIISGLQGNYLIEPKITVTVLEYRQLFVNGEIEKPGGYPFVPGMIVNKAISLAGGFTEKASRKEIFIIPDGDTNGEEFLANLNTYVGPGDILIVKEYQKLFVDGEVAKPGSYDFLHGLTVNQAITMAGGFTAKSSRNEILIKAKDSQEQIAVNLQTDVLPGDIITVKEYQKFFVDGEVAKPGSYNFLHGLTVNQAITMAGGFTQKSSRDEIFIKAKDSQEQIAVNLQTDVLPGDIIIIKEYKKFFVDGEVAKPGSYDFLDGLTVNQAITMAGGFTQKSSRDEIFIKPQDSEKQIAVNLQTKVLPGDILTIKQYQNFFIDGEVVKPGSYDFLHGLTINKAISIAGGFTDKASRDEIFIKTKDEKQIAANLYTDVLPGDIIRIKKYEKIFVDGEVKNSGGYEYLRDMTVKTAISMAGGFTETAVQDQIYISHKDDRKTQLLVDFYTPLSPGDIITIKKYKKFFVDGEVKNPDAYTYIKNMNVKTAISMAGGFTDQAARKQIHIIRPSQGENKILARLFTPVEPGDIITIDEYKKFFVNGEVKQPGAYDFIPDLTVEKAISLAGGFTQFASARWSKIYVHSDKTGKSKRAKLNTPVYPGDVIVIKESMF